MSGPVSPVDTAAPREVAGPAGTEITEGRRTVVGGVPVNRSLPRARRRTVGAWCFLDDFGPSAINRENSAEASMKVGPHPHIGLHTVTWVLAGEVLHRDSLGSEQVIRPGQLNLMTAGRGVAHAEETPAGVTGLLRGIQLWVAQPESSRHGPPAFEHHPVLPEADVGPLVAVVLVGELDGVRSPARADTPLVGADLVVTGPAALPLEPAFEYAVLPVDGPIAVDGVTVPAGALIYLPPGRDELGLAPAPGTHGAARGLLLGGEPFAEPVLMWWNFVARTEDEMAEARSAWEAGDDRFGPVESRLTRIPAPPPRWDLPGMRPPGK